MKQHCFRWRCAVSILALVWLACTAWALRGHAQSTQLLDKDTVPGTPRLSDG